MNPEQTVDRLEEKVLGAVTSQDRDDDENAGVDLGIDDDELFGRCHLGAVRVNTPVRSQSPPGPLWCAAEFATADPLVSSLDNGTS